MGHALRRHLAIQLIEHPGVAATDRARTLGKTIRLHLRLVCVDDDLGGVLPEPAQPEDGEQCVALAKADEKPVRSTFDRLVAEVLDQRRRDLVGIGPVGHLQVEHLEKSCSRQVETKRLSRCLDEAHHFAGVLRDIDQSLLRQREQGRER